jgi:hypothetical protein
MRRIETYCLSTTNARVRAAGLVLDEIRASALAVRRLNRTEYGNANCDLVSVDVDARELLPGGSSDQGFDNRVACIA